MIHSLLWLENDFYRLTGIRVTFPAFVLQFYMLDSYGVGISIEVGKRLVFGDPTIIDCVGDCELTSLVVHFNCDIPAEILERDFTAQSSPIVPYLARPYLKFRIVRYPAFQCDGVIFGATR